MIIEYMLKPKVGLKLFKTYRDLYAWLKNHENDLLKANVVVNKMHLEISFPNGSKLYLGYGETDEDLDRYRSLEYDFADGNYNDILKQRELIRRRF